VVATLPDVDFYSLPTGMSLASATIDPDSGQSAQLEFPGLPQTGLWSGTNANGQTVAGGMYTINASYTDNYGQTTSYSVSVQVVRAPSTVSVSVYNSAGELVRTILTQAVSGQPVPPVLSSTTLVPAAGAAKADSGLEISLGSTQLWWNGLNSAGQAVGPGVYLVKVTWSVNGAIMENVAKAVTVLAPSLGDPLDTAWMAPNPAPEGAGVMVIGLDPSVDAAGLTGRVYALDGGLVAALSPDADGRLDWSFGGRAAPGVYLIQLGITDAAGVKRTRVLKAALLP
jgi:hypothetical protein